MMIRRIIQIDEEKCNGCGLCVDACHEGAIAMVDGKAKLMRDDYCDGLGDCLPTCPTNAISFVEREAAPFDAEAVRKNMQAKQKPQAGGCPGSRAMEFTARMNPAGGCPGSRAAAIDAREEENDAPAARQASSLRQWPVQIKLVPVNAPYFDNANLLIAADCTAYAHANFHADFMRGKITLIGCPKLDEGNYADKLTEIIARNNIKSVTVARMEVPCCGGIEAAAKTAIQNSGKFLPWRIVTISVDGRILED
jgi:NAD-dependent dihydropyrimidine dehydrogenase PreA subunit